MLAPGASDKIDIKMGDILNITFFISSLFMGRQEIRKAFLMSFFSKIQNKLYHMMFIISFLIFYGIDAIRCLHYQLFTFILIGLMPEIIWGIWIYSFLLLGNFCQRLALAISRFSKDRFYSRYICFLLFDLNYFWPILQITRSRISIFASAWRQQKEMFSIQKLLFRVFLENC